MKYNELMERFGLLRNIPLVFEGRKLSPQMQAKVAIMKVAYEKEVAAFDKDMQDVLKQLKKEGFDDRARAQQKAQEVEQRKAAAEEWKEGTTDKEGKPVEKPAMPTAEELAEAKKARGERKAFEEEERELQEKYALAYNKKLEEESPMDERLFTEQELADIFELITPTGVMEIQRLGAGKEAVNRETFLMFLASRLAKL